MWLYSAVLGHEIIEKIKTFNAFELKDQYVNRLDKIPEEIRFWI